MTKTQILKSCNKNRTGAMLVLVAVVLIIFLLVSALCIDVANMQMVRSELRTATDAAAKAGAESLARTQDIDLARTAAIEIAARNQVAGDGLTLLPDDVLIGNSSPDNTGTFNFTEGAEPTNSVRILAERSTATPDGPVPLFMGGIFGRDTFSPSETATASATVRDIALVLDVSGSMGQSENGVTRLEALIQAVSIFLTDVEANSPNAKMSLISYTTNASRDIPLTDNFASIQDAVNQFQPLALTNIREAIEFGSLSLEQDSERRRFADRIIVVMTDGRFNAGGTPVPAAVAADDLGHTVHTITFSSAADQATMQAVAAEANGLHIHADDNNDLAEAFREIAATIAVLLVN